MSYLALLPLWQLLTILFGFGVIIGSFLNVFIYRFHTGKSLAGSSHCLSCQTPLRWYELFPLLSYLGLRGRCRTCRARIPSRYFWVELLTASLFVVAGLSTVLPILLLINLFLVTVLVVVLVYDIAHMVIPDGFVGALLLVALLVIGYQWYLVPDVWLIVDALGAGLAAFSFFAVLWWYSGGRWIGSGDAKLAVPLGMLVGLMGTFSMIVLSFWIGTIISLGLIGGQYLVRKRGQPHLRFMTLPLTMKSEVPFAPFLICGFITVYFFHADVLTFISYATNPLFGI